MIICTGASHYATLLRSGRYQGKVMKRLNGINYNIIYGIIAVIGLVITIVASLNPYEKNVHLISNGALEYNTGWEYKNSRVDTYDVCNLPLKLDKELYRDLTVRRLLGDESADGTYIMYRSKHAENHVYVGDKEIYTYGDQQSPLVSFKDGTTQIDLPSGETADQLLLSYEYEYEGRSSQDRDGLQTMVRRFKDDSLFPKALQQLKVGSKKQQRAAQAVFQAAVEEVSQAQNAVEVQNHAGQEAAVKRVLDAIRSRNFESAKGVFTEQGYQMFTSLINYGNARLLGKADLHFYESTNGRVVCRSIPMSFAFKSNHVTFTEEVTLTFNPEGQIESLAFGLDNDTRQLIFDSPAQWSTSVRMAIATFLENYKTAFALKDLDYIKSIFDDYAIIVTGHVTMRAPQNPELSQKGSTMVKYTQYNKEQYMKRLEEQFQQKKFINLRFTDVGVKLLGRGDDTYALRIKQDYFSSTYADTGYLFLMVDMNDPSAPLIKLRTWQPHRDPTINSNLPKDNPFHGLLYEGNFQ